MSKTNERPATSATDRAIAISAAVVLPAVFGLFALQHQLRPAPEPATVLPAITTVASDSPPADRANQPPAFSPGALAPTVRPAVTTTDDGAPESIAFHAPLELSHAGRAIANLSTYAPQSLPEPEPQVLAAELAAAATDLDLYADENNTTGRFPAVNQEIVAERRKFIARQEQASRRNHKGERNRRLARTQRGRRILADRLDAALYEPDDLFRPLHEPLRFWMNGRSDLAGMPLAMGDECRLDSLQAAHLGRVSATFRTFRRDVASLPDEPAKQAALLQRVAEHEWFRDDIPGLIQVLSAEEEPLRKELVRVLGSYQFPQSSQALARIATFDRSADVRDVAVKALEERPCEEYRDELLAGLRYVWPPAADNAARALVSLQDHDAYPRLAELVHRPDPRAPYQIDEHRWAAREFVRVNHMRNCLLCHAPAVAGNARVVAPVPTPYEPIPVVYYESFSGPNSAFLVRADVTYLRQDFSVVHADESVGDWPTMQRFDYFVRRRELSADEATEIARRFADDDYPQRKAVLFAMRKLHPAAKPAEASGRTLISSAD